MNTRFCFFVVLAATLAACSSSDRRGTPVQAQGPSISTQSGVQVTEVAPKVMNPASESQWFVELSWTDDGTMAAIKYLVQVHLAYLTGQSATIAPRSASSLVSHALTDEAIRKRTPTRMKPNDARFIAPELQR